ncbi:hypothetical protein LMG27198_39390 [Methylocystis echinoides]|uniref:Uncharacterized protein n=1 Tax=Methylocystis echinoides TaxID=29468 RepID=A0A9W6GXG3_9HYPH|nr:hypothetical protein LMG27198_39390 [Methylocystis echinoides]
MSQGGIELKFMLIDLKLASLNAGEVQNIIEDPHHRPARIKQLTNQIMLMRRKRLLLQQLRYAYDSVHRSPDFMAHVGQKFALSLIGGLC